MKTNTKAAPAEAVETPKPKTSPYGSVVAVPAAPFTQAPAFVRKKPIGS